jgi:homoserine dehydrogenase
VLFESTPINYQTGEPALGYLRLALEKGMHAITANKGPVVHGYQELKNLARKKGVSFYFESAVMDGAPVTTNLILSRMESGGTQEEAIAYAQSIGIAETDPSGDVDGWDAAVKVAALVTVLMGIPLTPEGVDRNGIRDITPDMIKDSAEIGKRWKLICSARVDPDSPNGLVAEVKPAEVGPESLLYHVSGTSAILEIHSDVLGKLSLIEDNPSPRTTAYGLLADFLNTIS